MLKDTFYSKKVLFAVSIGPFNDIEIGSCCSGPSFFKYFVEKSP